MVPATILFVFKDITTSVYPRINSERVKMNFRIIFWGFPIIVFLYITVKRITAEREAKEQYKSYLESDSKANLTRKADLDSVTYLNVPLDKLPFGASDDEQIKDFENTVKNLSGKRILNLTGKTSVQIKEIYGAQNLAEVSSYDDNFTKLVQTVYSWGERLLNLGFEKEGVCVLEFGIDSLTDISGNYKLLADVYAKYSDKEKLKQLEETASNLDSLSKDSIINYILQKSAECAND